MIYEQINVQSQKRRGNKTTKEGIRKDESERLIEGENK